MLERLAPKAVFSALEARAVGESLRLTPRDVVSCLGRLVRGGWIQRVRHGLYLYLDPFTRDSRAHPWLLATHVVQPSAISHWTALAHWELTTQISDTVQATTTRQVRKLPAQSSGRRPLVLLGQVAVEFVRVRQSRFFGVADVRMGRWSVPIFDRERTLLDCFLQSEYFGGVSVGLEILESHLREFEIDRLVHYAIKAGSTHAIKRLGWALAQADVPNRRIAPLRSYPVAERTRIKLEPRGKPAGRLEADWHLLLNV